MNGTSSLKSIVLAITVSSLVLTLTSSAEAQIFRAGPFGAPIRIGPTLGPPVRLTPPIPRPIVRSAPFVRVSPVLPVRPIGPIEALRRARAVATPVVVAPVAPLRVPTATVSRTRVRVVAPTVVARPTVAVAPIPVAPPVYAARPTYVAPVAPSFSFQYSNPYSGVNVSYGVSTESYVAPVALSAPLPQSSVVQQAAPVGGNEGSLPEAAQQLHESLSRMETDQAEVWLDYLDPMKVAVAYEQEDVSTIAQLLQHYDGVALNQELSSITSAPGFGQTRQLMREIVGLAEDVAAEPSGVAPITNAEATTVELAPVPPKPSARPTPAKMPTPAKIAPAVQEPADQEPAPEAPTAEEPADEKSPAAEALPSGKMKEAIDSVEAAFSEPVELPAPLPEPDPAANKAPTLAEPIKSAE